MQPYFPEVDFSLLQRKPGVCAPVPNNHIEHYGDNFNFVIPTEDAPLHTPDHPFCFDPTCPCHESAELLAEVARLIEQGLMTPQEATDFVAGRTI